jgi:hypothetical protein
MTGIHTWTLQLSLSFEEQSFGKSGVRSNNRLLRRTFSGSLLDEAGFSANVRFIATLKQDRDTLLH